MNGFGINGAVINGAPANSGNAFILEGFDSAAPGIIQLAIGFRIGMGLTETFSKAGLFFWDEKTECQYEEIYVADLDTTFDSIRDNGSNNKFLEQELRCITGIVINHKLCGGN